MEHYEIDVEDLHLYLRNLPVRRSNILSLNSSTNALRGERKVCWRHDRVSCNIDGGKRK